MTSKKTDFIGRDISDDLWEKLAKVAVEAANNAYAPYSKFQVGSALLAADGTIYPGCNVENASFGATSCAERSSIGHAITDGQREFYAIAIYNASDHVAAPCGICRQVLSEFCDDLPLLLFCHSGKRIFTTLGELLPLQFKKDSLRHL